MPLPLPLAVIIRPATLADYHVLRAIADAVHEMHAAAVPEVFRSGSAAMPSDYYAYLLRNSTGTVYVAERAGVVTGYLVLEIERSRVGDEATVRRIAHIEQIGVARDARRRGIGRALIETAVAWAKGQNADELRLNVWEFNGDAIAFYEHLGLHTQSRTMSLVLKP